MRNVYFSFHYERDIWRVNQVRNSGLLFGARSVGFADGSIWEEAKTKGKGALERLIDEGMEGTSVTVVLIGSQTAARPWVLHEIERSIERGNAVLGIRIHHLKDRRGKVDKAGGVPLPLKRARAPIRRWNHNAAQLGRWVEEAFQKQIDPGKKSSGGQWGWALAAGVVGVAGLAAWLHGKKKPSEES